MPTAHNVTATSRTLRRTARRLGYDPLEDGRVVFVTHGAGDLGVDTPCVVRASRNRYEVLIERGKTTLAAHFTDPALALAFAEEKVRFLDLRMAMRWESGCSDCHRQVRGALRAAGRGASVHFDHGGLLATTTTFATGWFASRSEAHAFAEERTPPDCPTELAGLENPSEWSPEDRKQLYLAHRRGYLTRWEHAPWLWTTAMELREGLAHAVVRVQAGNPPGDATAHLPPAFADRYDSVFLTRYLVAVDDLCERVLTRVNTLPGCAAQEIALGAIVLLTGQLLEKLKMPVDFEDIWDEAFWDTDFLWLYDGQGLATLAHPGIRANLRPANLGFHQWFEPFSGEQLPAAALTPKAALPGRVTRLLQRARRLPDLTYAAPRQQP